MGCDIHCYIEYKKSTRSCWRDFGGKINPGRNYSMFGALAGVRSDGIPHIEPRGFAPNMATAAFSDCSTYISGHLKEGWGSNDGSIHYSRAYATECVQKGYCQWLPRSDTDNPPSFVSNSDWHSHSWLTPDEFELAIATYLKTVGFQVGALQITGPAQVNGLSLTTKETSADDRTYYLNAITEYWPILHAMRCFEAQGCEARLVFWFDN